MQHGENMISVVVVYNNEHMFNDILMKGLKNQTAEFELIALDNTKGEFKSASEALNYGGKRATGKYIMFVHQDVDLGSNSWLEDVEKILDDIPDLGIAGVAGASEVKNSFSGRYRGYISNGGEPWGHKTEKEEEVQVLDELLLIVPRSQFDKMQFDEKTFDHWHCYGADYSLSVRKMGLKAYVIPAFVYHRSVASNTKNFREYMERLYNKHKKEYKRIYTTSGNASWTSLKMMALTDLVRPTYLALFPEMSRYLERDLSDCKSVLDLGCSYNSPIKLCNLPFSVGVEFSDADLEESRKKCVHDQYIKSKIDLVDFKAGSFDAVISISSLDNLTKDEKRRLINKMERWAKKKVIIVTANGGSKEKQLKKDPQRCDVEELESLGFKVYGIYGWKRLREYDKSNQTRRIMSDLTQKITYRHPRYALHLYAVKELEETPA
jgi:hypothetical protein